MKKKRNKGNFGEINMPVARQYLVPEPRRRMIVLGLMAAGIMALYAGFDFFAGRSGFLSNGPLASSHAAMESDCSACHTNFAAVAPEKCSACHEKYGDKLGVYSFPAHYLYRSGDFRRVGETGEELPCSACHPDHQGRHASMIHAPNDRCAGCHEFGSFDNHPEFAELTEPESTGLAFTHIHHVREIIKRDGAEDVEQVCLTCHQPEADGRGFRPIAFDSHCDSCHLTTSVATPRLPVQQSGSLGVLTLETIRKQQGPGDLWSWYANPGEFRKTGNRLISKSPLHHEDDWVMANLRRFRSMIHPDAGLNELLNSTATRADLPELAGEALDTLRGQALELRSRPEQEVQDELARINGLIKQVERALEDPYLELETDAFLPPSRRDSPLQPERLEEVLALAADLTEPCRTCHLMDQATIVRVSKDQASLKRAEFDHGAHIMVKRCLDCHSRIPIEEAIYSGADIDPAQDVAAIRNLPGIDSCRDCHNPNQASDRCVTCHQFHPDKERHGQLLPYSLGGRQ